ncbi:MAG: S1 RNA-binding domain-containing protein, partial [Thaumarchaeota archaeon]|nr:S1 RNA-binding domain-containing protein [Nitrososphaerota archaeon]
MPNRLFGRVPITAVSKYLTKRVESAVAEDGDSDGGDDEGGDGQGVDGTELASRFSVGQYVRAHVLSTMDEDTTNSGRGKKHIELSLLPELANSGLEAKDLVQNCTVMASVESAEDHGYVMDISISGSNIRGFLAKKEVDPGVAEERMNVGSTLLCIVGDKGSRKKTVQLSTLPTKLGTVAHIASDATTINTFLPGTAVEVLVSDVLGRGLVGKVMGSLDVTADLFHSGAGPDGTDLDVKYKVGSKFRARVICNFPSASKPKLGVSVLPHIASLEAKTTTDHGKQKLPLDALASSAIVERCTITKVQSGVGVFVDVGVTGVSGFVPMAKLSDARVDSLFEDSGPFKVGSEHRGRVIGYSAVDGLFSLSFEKHILEQQYLRVADIPVGEVVHGQVDRFVFNEKGVGGMIVHLADGISGLVPATHFSDVQLKDPEAKFRKGNKVKARVLSADPVKNQLKLTLKKTLVNSEDPALCSYDQLGVGMKSLAT